MRENMESGEVRGLEKCDNVPSGYLSKNSQRTHNAAQFHHKPSKNSPNTHWVHFDHMVGTFKQTLDELMTVPNPSIGGYLGGYFVKILKMCLVVFR